MIESEYELSKKDLEIASGKLRDVSKYRAKHTVYEYKKVLNNAMKNYVDAYTKMVHLKKQQ